MTHAPLRVLVAHNAYRERGGEDAVAEAEVALLRANDHPVEMYARHNDELVAMPRLAAARDTLWSTRTVRELERAIHEFRPDVIHVHNTFPLISPSLYWQAARAGVPVVQTLHNFRLLCPQAMLLRAGSVCEDCVGRVPWRSVPRHCYRNSASQSALLTGMLAVHRFAGTWATKVTRYVALNEFCRRKFVAGGLPVGKLVVKPNFVESSGADAADPSVRSGFLFVGRLEAEKGIAILADALRSAPDIALRVAGSGRGEELLRSRERATLLGLLPAQQVRGEMRSALALVMPSICYENFPRSLVEAFACGLPVIASRLGAMAELVDDRRTGLLFKAGDVEDLITKLRWAQAHPAAMRAMGCNARREYEAKYTPQTNYRQLIAIYQEAIREVRGVAH